MNVSLNLMRRIIKNYLNLLLYKMRKRQYLTCSKAKKCLIEQRFFLEIWRLAEQETVFFSYEKLFTVKDYVNNQIERLYAKYSPVIDESVRTVYRWHGRGINRSSDEKLFTIEASVNNQNDIKYIKSSVVIDKSVRTVYHRQKPFSLMVRAAVFKSWKSPLIFVLHGVKINTDKINIMFQDFGVRRCGLLHRLIWIQWIFRCGICWKQTSFLLLIQVLLLWRQLFWENGL